MTHAGKAAIDQQEGTEAGASRDDLGAPFSLSALAKSALTHHQPRPSVVLPDGNRAPSGAAVHRGAWRTVGYQQVALGIPVHCLLQLPTPVREGCLLFRLVVYFGRVNLTNQELGE